MARLLSFCFDRHRQLKLTAGGALSYFHPEERSDERSLFLLAFLKERFLASLE
jgi:hypothetical protein